ncbi:hypothetical protein QQF64_026610 [Cirrhinus molitorella]|uniref:Uncharacterized protein n=1 Tax=Cirrhinus molitorella TaxID=172907 RepID=A0ABR3NAD5_9TELE
MHRAAQLWNHELVRVFKTSGDLGSVFIVAHNRRNKQDGSAYNDLRSPHFIAYILPRPRTHIKWACMLPWFPVNHMTETT